MKKENKTNPSGSSKKVTGSSASNRVEPMPTSTKAARDEAMQDIENDADLSIHSPNDDLDEGETARLGEDRTDLI